MSNYKMSVDIFGHGVACQTDGLLVNIPDLVLAGNNWRINNGLSVMSPAQIMRMHGFIAFVAECSKQMGIPEDQLVQVRGKGRAMRTWAHIVVAIYIAECMSPALHVSVIREFVEGRLLQYRELGGTEFKNLNAAIDMYLPGREGKDSNQGLYIQVAKLLRKKVGAEDWALATAQQTRYRYELEDKLVNLLRLGVVRDYDHLKDLIDRL